MIKCKYAGDKTDEFCKDCNGTEMVVGDKKILCDSCAGYEPTEEKIEKKPVTKNTTKSKSNTSKNPEVNNDTTTAEKLEIDSKNNKNNVVTEHKNEEKQINMNGVTVKSLKYMSGVTICHDDTYYKFTAEEEWEVNPDLADMNEVRKALWDHLNKEVDDQVSDVIS
jgi:hypothetical protein